MLATLSRPSADSLRELVVVAAAVVVVVVAATAAAAAVLTATATVLNLPCFRSSFNSSSI